MQVVTIFQVSSFVVNNEGTLERLLGALFHLQPLGQHSSPASAFWRSVGDGDVECPCKNHGGGSVEEGGR